MLEEKKKQEVQGFFFCIIGIYVMFSVISNVQLSY